jgi:Zn-dependent protease/predicted transcriptional regulator
MIMGGFRLGSIMGFEIRIDASWFIIFFLLFWSLSFGIFPYQHPDLPSSTHYLMGFFATILFFASLLAHELSHSVVAKAKGIPVEGITLFIFGGMAHTRMEAEEPGDEMAIAGIGPVASIVIAGLFGGFAWLGGRAGWSEAIVGPAGYLAWINLILAAFNLLPGFPLDGGRLFRAALWKATGDMTKATRWASIGGQTLGWLLIGVGALQLLAGGVLGGLWLVFIGWFLRTAAQASFRQHALQDVLRGVPARDVMTSDPATVSADLTLRKVVDEKFLRHRYQCYPVVGGDGSDVVGLVTLEQVKEVDRNDWDRTRVKDVMTPRREIEVRPDEPMTDVLDRMREGRRRVLVVRDGRLMGVISAGDVARWVQLEQDLQGVRPLGLPSPQTG